MMKLDLFYVMIVTSLIIFTVWILHQTMFQMEIGDANGMCIYIYKFNFSVICIYFYLLKQFSYLENNINFNFLPLTKFYNNIFRCATCQSCGSNDPGFNCSWQKSFTECGPCASQSSCPSCGDTYTEGQLIIQCIQCERLILTSILSFIQNRYVIKVLLVKSLKSDFYMISLISANTLKICDNKRLHTQL